MQRPVNYVGNCPNPVTVHFPGKKPEQSVCGRPITASQIHRNFCPACKRPLHDSQPEYNKTQEMARRAKRL